jgi:hypothetical protein
VGWLYENRGDDLSPDIPGPARWLLNPGEFKWVFSRRG